MNSNGRHGGLFLIAEWIMKFAVTNILWLFCNVPVLFIVFNMVETASMPLLLLLATILVILMPLTVFPATMALFATVREWIIVEKDSGQLLKAYFRYYKENYLRAVQGGIILTILWVILAIDLYYFFNHNMVLFYLLAILSIILYVFTVNFASISVHYNMSLKIALKNAFMITLGSPLLFLATAMSGGIVIYISMNVFRVLFVFFTFSFIAFLSFAAFYRQYLTIIEKQNNQ